MDPSIWIFISISRHGVFQCLWETNSLVLIGLDHRASDLQRFNFGKTNFMDLQILLIVQIFRLQRPILSLCITVQQIFEHLSSCQLRHTDLINNLYVMEPLGPISYDQTCDNILEHGYKGTFCPHNEFFRFSYTFLI